MGGLSASRWASTSLATARSSNRNRGVEPSSTFPSSRLEEPRLPSSSSSSPHGGSRTPPQQELSRFLKIVSRIRWKLPFLDYGYRQATDYSEGRSRQEIEASEIHFKIDFYEIYMHLERAIVHLLGVYGIDVHPSPPGGNLLNNGTANASINGNGNGNSNDNAAAAAGKNRGQRIGQHQYHVNVLLALDDPRNPLHAVLGTGEARRQLWSAKDLRNRWKTADSDSVEADEGGGRRYTVAAPLEAYNLEMMLSVILAALEEAYNVTLRYLEETRTSSQQPGDATAAAATARGSSSGGHGGGGSSSMEEEQDWGFIADAMDWEAV